MVIGFCSLLLALVIYSLSGPQYYRSAAVLSQSDFNKKAIDKPYHMLTLLHNIAQALILEENDDERQGYLSYNALWTLRSDNGDVHENVGEKHTSHHFKLFRDYPN